MAGDAVPGFRADIEGMRAVAVLAVVLYHVDVVRGGFVGVDVFFVLSGFLITGLLWREVANDGRIAFATFYGRRARRLLPASTVVLVATTIGASIWLSPLAARSVLGDAKAAALYVANYRFIALRTDYLATRAPSPLQHYWSLAVEEQFYLIWPVLLFALTRMWRSRVAAIWWTIAALAVASFLLSWHWTTSSESWAFFSLPARAWQLMAGALVGFGNARLRRLRASVATALTWVGLGAVVWSIFAFSSSTRFPGTAALVPVLGTVALLVGGCATPARGARVLLDRAPFQFVGRLSYAWYLWHWPVIVLAPIVAGHPLTRLENVGLAAASGVIAFTTVLLVERPLRFAARLTTRPRRSLALGATLTAATLVAAASITATLPSLSGHGQAVALTPKLGAPGAQAAFREHLTTPEAVRSALASAVQEREVPANLSPSLVDAAHDKAAPFLDGCDDTFSDARVHHCVYGDPNGTKTIVLFGDSHAAMFEPGFDLVAKARRWRLVVLSKATCPPFIISLFSPILGREFSECGQWREAALTRIGEEHPAVVVVTSARHYGPEYHFRVYSPEWNDGIAQVVSRLRHLADRVVVLSPAPRPPGDVPGCLSAHLHDIGRCAMPTGAAVPILGFFAEGKAAIANGAVYFDITPWLCTPKLCPPIVGNLLVYRDDNHITTSYARWLSPAIAQLLDTDVAR